MNKIVTKIIGASVEGLSKNFLPRGATKYNLVTGVTVAKGKFEITSLFDKNNQLLKRVIYYPEIGVKQVRNYTNFGNNRISRNINEKILKDGKKIKENNTSIWTKRNDDDRFFMTKEQIDLTNKSNDLHEIALLQKGESKKGFEYYALWNGEKPTISKLMNITDTSKLDDSLLEYLPCFVSKNTKSRASQKFAHMAKIQEKKFGLEGITPKPRRISNIEVTDDGENIVCSGRLDPFTGQISVDKDIINSNLMLQNLGHEYQHASDYSAMLRADKDEVLKTTIDEIQEIEKRCPGAMKFAKRSISKSGIERDKLISDLEKSANNYKIANRSEYLNNLLEIRARAAGKEEAEKINDSFINISNFLLK